MTRHGTVALSFSPDGIAIAVSQHKNGRSILIHCEFVQTNNKQAVLMELVERFHLEQYDCTLVLSADDYRLITIEVPSVSEKEWMDAIRWKVADLIEFPIENAVIDYYLFPKSLRANSKKRMEVVVTSQSAIQPLVDLCQQCNLQLTIIDIQDTSIRNLAMLLPENENGVAVLHMQKALGRIIIQQQNALYLSRKLAIGYDRLGIVDSFLSEEQVSMEQGGLALDVQRSLDYVESVYRLPPISGLAVIPLPENTQGLLNFLSQNHGITARIMDLSTIVESNVVLDDNTQSLCAPVIGATLRQSVEVL